MAERIDAADARRWRMTDTGFASVLQTMLFRVKRRRRRRKLALTFDRDETLGLAVEFVLICSRMSDKLLN